MKSRILKIAGAIGVAFNIFMAFGWSFFELTVRCKTHKRQTKRKWFQLSHTKINHPRDKFEKEYEEGKAWCREQDMQNCYIKSIDGLILHAYYLPAENPKRFVILCHGYKGSGFGDFAYTARFLHENNCNLLFIDQRCCGESQGEYITFGAMEQYDVQRWAYFIARHSQQPRSKLRGVNRNVQQNCGVLTQNHSQQPRSKIRGVNRNAQQDCGVLTQNHKKDKLPIYLYGESMGAASVLMASGQHLPRDVKGLISDCGFRSMKRQMQDMAANWFHLHWIGLMLFRLKLFCRVFAKFNMKDADTANALKTNKRPVLFFHGLKDTYVRPGNTRFNYSLCRAPKELVLIPEARHLCSAYVNPELYREKLTAFFAKCERNEDFLRHEKTVPKKI